MTARAGAALLLCCLLLPAAAYLPGVAPRAYRIGEKIPLEANKVSSTKTQLPYEYYDLPFCKKKNARTTSENLGDVLVGDSVTVSPYDLHVKQDKSCVILCRKNYHRKEVALFREMIDQEYRVHWFLDDLPVVVHNEESGYVTRGYPIGFVAPDTLPHIKGKHFLYNHVRIIVRYNQKDATSETVRIIGFQVIPFSIKHEYDGPSEEFDEQKTVLDTCNQFTPAQYNPQGFQSVEDAGEVIFTYDVKWEQTDTHWSNRWDIYLRGNPDDEIHYFSIVNSLMIVLFLTGVVAMIMLRTLHKDITAYNEMQTLEEAQEESGWKLVHGDVFRPPAFSPMLLSVFAGSGVQVLAMTVSTMVCALLGLLSPANRGGLLTATLMLFVAFGSLSGYCSARLYKLFHGKEWKKNTLLTALVYPGSVFLVFFLIDLFLHYEGSSSAVPFSTMLMLVFLWFGISTPLVFGGSYFGFKKETIEVPVKTNQIARHIPEQVWYTHPLFAVALGGVLPFGAVCIELFFIMSALWLHQIYYVFGFLFVVLLILIATCAEITIVMCYFQLCNEDYHWWWRSFLCSGSSALYLFAYSIWYFSTKLEIEGFVSTIVYFGYMTIISITFFLLTGSIGFWSALWFTRKIYGAIKVD